LCPVQPLASPHKNHLSFFIISLLIPIDVKEGMQFAEFTSTISA
jgi:hypothetical protein